MCTHLLIQILSRYSLLRDLGSAFPAPVLLGGGKNTDKNQQNKTTKQNSFQVGVKRKDTNV